MSIQQILIKYWGHSSFRPLQEEIIESVLKGQDTLALLPTGGGKSICFQVPALVKEGICIVVSPLIALMKDQVMNLQKRKISAAAIYSGMEQEEIQVILQQCTEGRIKFLYVSPERLITRFFREKLIQMPVSLIAVDEAHCISQWGYDFRPPYLNIADVRALVPDVPIIALTATATPKVVTDIQEKLKFSNGQCFQKSFVRENLSYLVFKEENKLDRLLKACYNIKGSGIIYVRSRRKTQEIAQFLAKHGVSASYYHAGLSPEERTSRQHHWVTNKVRIMVSTNAFGMGIDKPDVRFVVHMDIPDSLEAYFQEAGRAGRDEQKSWAAMFWNEADIKNLEYGLEASFPDAGFVQQVYKALGSHLNILHGSGMNATFSFSISDFASKYNFPAVKVYNSLKLLEKQGYILLNEAIYEPSRIKFNIEREKLYEFQVKYPEIDVFVKLLLRSYNNLFNHFIAIDEYLLANRMKASVPQIQKFLYKLHKNNIITYIQQSHQPRITFLQGRQEEEEIQIKEEHIQERKAVAEERLEAVKDYVSREHHCRQQLLLQYFGEESSKRCGQCDVCLDRNKVQLSKHEFDTIIDRMKPELSESEKTLDELLALFPDMNNEKLAKALNWLIDNNKIIKQSWYYHWNHNE